MKRAKPLLTSRDILPVCFLGVLGIQFFLLILMFLVFIAQREITTEAKNRAFVEKKDGQMFIASTRKLSQPSAEAIKFFVRDWLKQQYSFSGRTLDPEGKVIPDSGITVKYKNEVFLVPSSVYQASFAVDSENRSKFLYLLSQEWLSEDFFNLKNITIDFEIKEMSEPKIHDRKTNVWGVDIIGQLSYSGGMEVRRFNRRILIKPVEIPLEPEAATASLFERLSYQWKSRGFSVVGITRY